MYQSLFNQEKEREITRKVENGRRLSTEEGLYLFQNGQLGFLASLATIVRERKNGNYTYFNRNFHIEPTNICIYTCKFCSYSRLIKQRSDGWELTHDDIMRIVKSYDDQPVTEVHIVGGVLPQYDTRFYSDLFKAIKAHRPELHIKALTPVEYHYIFKKDKLSYEEGMQLMKESGLDSLPGGGAEVFAQEIREKIAKDKCTAEQWLRIHEIWHNLGGKSNATILYGHIESYAHRINHLELLRNLQDITGGFQTFIPLKFLNKDNEMSHLPEVTVLEDLRNYAVSRIFLDNFDHIKAYWPMIGRETAQLSLSFGVDDLDGTIDDTTKIYTMAGSEEQNPSLTSKQLAKLIAEGGRTPVERDTLYNIIKEYSPAELTDDLKGYVALPLAN